MQSSNNAKAYYGGECENDDNYAYTPSGIRTKVALKQLPHGVVVPLVNPVAQQALNDLAAADEAREEEEPTTDWTSQRNELGEWDTSQLQALVNFENARELGFTETIEELTEADVELIDEAPSLPHPIEVVAPISLAEAELAATIPAGEYTSPWQLAHQPMWKTPFSASRRSWLVFGVLVLTANAALALTVLL